MSEKNNPAIRILSGHDAVRVKKKGDPVTMENRVTRWYGPKYNLETGYMLEDDTFVRHSFPYACGRPGHEPACRRVAAIDGIEFDEQKLNWDDFEESLHGETLWYQHDLLHRDESEGPSRCNLLGRYRFVEEQYDFTDDPRTHLVLPTNEYGQPIYIENETREEMIKPHRLWTKNGWDEWTESHYYYYGEHGVHGRNGRGPNNEYLACYPRGRKNYDISGDLDDVSDTLYSNIEKGVPDRCWLNQRFIFRDGENSVVHREDGPAVIVSEDEETHTQWKAFIEGVMIPDELLSLPPEEIDVQKYLKEENLEIRRIAFDRIGWKQVLEKSNAKVLHQGRNDVQNTLEMLVEMPGRGEDGRNERYLIGNCPSTAKFFAMLVDPEVSTCEEAQAFLSGKETNRCIGAS